MFFEPLMTQDKRDNDDIQDLITEFFIMIVNVRNPQMLITIGIVLL